MPKRQAQDKLMLESIINMVDLRRAKEYTKILRNNRKKHRTKSTKRETYSKKLQYGETQKG